MRTYLASLPADARRALQKLREAIRAAAPGATEGFSSMAFAFFEPNRSWRWGVLPLVGQFVWMLLSPGPGNLLPLGVIVFAVLSVPPIIAARIGAFIATKTGKAQ